MTYLHFIVYALCLSQLTMVYIWFNGKLNEKPRQIMTINDVSDQFRQFMKKEIDKLIEEHGLNKTLRYIKQNEHSWPSFEIKSFITGAISNEMHNVRVEAMKIVQSEYKSAEEIIKKQIQELWEKQFFANKRDTKND